MNVEHFANLEEILVEANVECARDKRIVTDVFLNDESFTEIYPHQAEDIERGEIRTVEIHSVPMGKMALDISDELFKVTRVMNDGSDEVARLFRQGDDQEALSLFLDLLDVTRNFMSMVGILRAEFIAVNDPGFVSLVERMSDLLGEMGDILGSEDWILLADMIEFEFKPLCEAWNRNIRSLREGINAGLN
jgi:hypothetical protein